MPNFFKQNKIYSYFKTLFNIYFPLFFKNKGLNYLFIDAKNEKTLINEDISPNSKAIVFIIHGWFGDYNSPIVFKYFNLLKNDGFGIVRVNLKDHGQTHDLNKSLFSFTDVNYIEEIIQSYTNRLNKKIILLGISFGANIILRMNKSSFQNRIICLVLVTPVFNVKNALECIDKDRIIKPIFHSQWKKNLKIKQLKFPEIYDFTWCLKQNCSLNIIKGLVKYYRASTLNVYLQSCKVTTKHVFSIKYPTLLFISENDPVINFKNHFYLKKEIIKNNMLSLKILKYGGHNAFNSQILKYISNKHI